MLADVASLPSLSIVADRQITHAESIYSQYGDVRLVDGRQLRQNDLLNADTLLVRSVAKVDASLLDGTGIRFVGSATSGIDHIDLQYLEQNQIAFAYAPGSNARSVAEYVLSSLLLIARETGRCLQEKTIGIIGVGQVGRRLQQFMQCLGVRCLLNDPPRAFHDHAEKWSSLEQVCTADIISFHVPFTTDGDYPTESIINENLLQKLKPDVVLVNTARGGIVDEAALLKFKHNNPDCLLILDVWQNEPDINYHLLDAADIATPHIAGYSYDGKLKATKMLADALAHISLDDKDDNFVNNVNVSEQSTTLSITSLEQVIRHAYDPEQDTSRLKAILKMAKEVRVRYFDDLRKDYPLRREFPHYVLSHVLNSEQKAVLKKLGFQIK